MKTTIALCFVMAVLCSSVSVMARNIIIAKNATETEQFAATLLQQHLQEIFQQDFPIANGPETSKSIFVGAAASRLLGQDYMANLRPDEIIIKTKGQQVGIGGSLPRGVIYAVLEYLERGYGVRFLTAAVTVVPRRKDYGVPPLDIRYAPPFISREIWSEYQRDARFAMCMRLNGTHSVIPTAWGGHLPIIGWVHTFDRFVPAKEHFARHPEWYCEVKGKRINYGQPCLSNQAYRKQFLQAVRKELKTYSSPKFISVSQNDIVQPCQCSKCREFVSKHGNQTDLLIDFVNWIAASLESEYPDLLVETLAYQYTEKPPATIRPRHNVLIRLCSMRANQAQALNTEGNRKFRDNLLQWSQLASHLYVWNYVTNFTNSYQAVPNLHLLAEDLRFFARNKTLGVFEQGDGNAGAAADLGELRFYLIAKLLWDPSQDTEAIIEDFCRHYYGKAAPYVIKYVKLIRQASLDSPKLNLDCYTASTDAWLKPVVLRRMYDVMHEGMDAIRDNNVLLARLEAASLSLHFMLLARALELQKTDLFSGMDWERLLTDQLVIAGRPGNKVRSLREGGSWRDIKPSFLSLMGKFEQHGEVPMFVGGRKAFLYALARKGGSRDSKAKKVLEDVADSATGTVVRMPTDNTIWLNKFQNFPRMRAGIYAEVRCDQAVPGNAFSVGVYDLNTKREKSASVPARKIAGTTWKWVKLFSYTLTPTSQIYLAPANNPAVGNVWVDRIMVVDEGEPRKGHKKLPMQAHGRPHHVFQTIDCVSPSRLVDVVPDSASSVGLAVCMPTTHTSWQIQWASPLSGKARLLAEVRCDNKVQGQALTLGIYNTQRKKERLFPVEAEKIAGNGYHVIEFGPLTIDRQDIIFVAPAKNAPAGAIWIDRLFLIE